MKFAIWGPKKHQKCKNQLGRQIGKKAQKRDKKHTLWHFGYNSTKNCDNPLFQSSSSIYITRGFVCHILHFSSPFHYCENTTKFGSGQTKMYFCMQFLKCLYLPMPGLAWTQIWCGASQRVLLCSIEVAMASFGIVRSTR